MKDDPLTALSPLDGRYRAKIEPLRPLLSEYGLLKARVRAELAWFRELCACEQLPECPRLSEQAKRFLDDLETNFTVEDAARIKTIEAQTNHDVKAVEYFLKERFRENDELATVVEFVHFACTSEDINNLAYGLIIKRSRDTVLMPVMKSLERRLADLALQCRKLPMLARTHGQAASPTTLGKEMATLCARLRRERVRVSQVQLTAKINGATGNFNAHQIACPEVDWITVSHRVVASLELQWLPLTTQIEPHDGLAELCDALAAYNTVMMALCQDLWHYISFGYFRLHLANGEIGSSTMPHKVNPIDFENAEGNFGLANALCKYFSAKLPVSRLQRDLSDSTVQRSVGSAFGYTLLALRSVEKGLGKLEPDEARLAADLAQHWEVLAEAVQTVMRRYGVTNPYERLKALTRGRSMDQAAWTRLIGELELPENVRQRLMDLQPAEYIGLAAKLTERFLPEAQDNGQSKR